MIRFKLKEGKAGEKGAGHAKIWFSLSLFLSFALLVWSFSLPFRDSTFTTQVEKEADQNSVQTTEIKFRKRQVEEMRDAALLLDQALMEKVREKYRGQEKPGIQESKEHWNRHVESVKRQVKEIGRAPEGSLEAQYQRELIGSLSDAPPE